MISAVAFDMGGVIYKAAPDPQMQLSFAARAMELIRSQGVPLAGTPEEFAARLAEADKARKRDCERRQREIPPLDAWADYYLKGTGATRQQLLPIAEELCFGWNHERNRAVPGPGLMECVAGLYGMGIRMAVISNTLSRSYVPYLLQTYGVSRYFELVLLSSVMGWRKPDRRAFQECERLMGLDKSQLAYVGDTISRDVIGVENAAWALMIRLPNPDAKESERVREAALEDSGHRPGAVAGSLSDIPRIVAQYNLSHPG